MPKCIPVCIAYHRIWVQVQPTFPKLFMTLYRLDYHRHYSAVIACVGSLYELRERTVAECFQCHLAGKAWIVKSWHAAIVNRSEVLNDNNVWSRDRCVQIPSKHSKVESLSNMLSKCRCRYVPALQSYDVTLLRQLVRDISHHAFSYGTLFILLWRINEKYAFQIFKNVEFLPVYRSTLSQPRRHTVAAYIYGFHSTHKLRILIPEAVI